MSERHLSFPERHPPIKISNEMVLTQYGVATSDGQVNLRGGPRRGEHGLSLIVGRVDPIAAALLVRQHQPVPQEVVRHVRAGLLREAGFVVQHDPADWNAAHAFVTVPGGSDRWDNSHKKAFKAAFERQQQEEGAS